MPMEKETKFRVMIEVDVDVPNGSMSETLLKIGDHLKTSIPYVTRINHVAVTSHTVIKNQEE